jgi:hypothetical protein
VSCDTSYLSFFHQDPSGNEAKMAMIAFGFTTFFFFHKDPSGNEAEMAMIAFGFVAFFCTLWWQRGP